MGVDELMRGPWMTGTKFRSGAKITERIWMLIKASGLPFYDGNLPDIHNEVKKYPRLCCACVDDDDNGFDGNMLIFDIYDDELDFLKNYPDAKFYTKKEVEEALIKYINSKVKEEEYEQEKEV